MSAYSGRVLRAEAPQFWERLTEEMDTRKLGSRELEGKSGVDKSTISRWRQPGNKRAIDVEKVRQIAPFLGTTAEDLLGLPPPEAAPPPATPPPASILDDLSALERNLPRLRELAEEAEG
jgi:transcriptional regulator with XRE-family HTH domain